jgi:hypothetical protein
MRLLRLRATVDMFSCFVKGNIQREERRAYMRLTCSTENSVGSYPALAEVSEFYARIVRARRRTV